MSLLIAMSIDYSLFLLSRYREELLSGKSTEKIVEVFCFLDLRMDGLLLTMEGEVSASMFIFFI